MLVISIDGACRRNGKPNCVSAGGVFVMQYEIERLVDTKIFTNFETGSTNQRGELLALLTALDHVWEAKSDAQIITDSEYIFNSMTKNWCDTWLNNGWNTSAGTPVKNKDIWMAIDQAHKRCVDNGLEVMYYHVKGHAMSFGKVTATKLLDADDSGYSLYKKVEEKLRTTALKEGMYETVNMLSLKNNGFELDGPILAKFICTNIVADAVATKCVEAADALM